MIGAEIRKDEKRYRQTIFTIVHYISNEKFEFEISAKLGEIKIVKNVASEKCTAERGEKSSVKNLV